MLLLGKLEQIEGLTLRQNASRQRVDDKTELTWKNAPCTVCHDVGSSECLGMWISRPLYAFSLGVRCGSDRGSNDRQELNLNSTLNPISTPRFWGSICVHYELHQQEAMC